ncbi:tapasin-related protein-like [Xyrichtys novacula]|uniref:Tapasin-related protein-like n=2 Tax=Xyrichtys novacula TaxID=13765 RepID=A0AAV1FY01_XYRNO|nr:tapasin-related protein-like [Xyrichtys novacula]
MDLTLKLPFYLVLWQGVMCINQVPWLRCTFSDGHLFINDKGQNDTTVRHREAVLQFGQKGEAPVHPQAVTFLVAGSKLELRQYLQGEEAEQIKCEIWRFSTHGVHVRWPVKEDKEYSRWFTCILKHTKDLFTVIGFLRHPTDEPPTGEQDYYGWPIIKDREILTTTVAMVTKTLSPLVKTGLGTTQRLHCQFAVDHKAPQVTVEWHRYHQARRIRLFSHNNHTRQTEGSGVELTSIANGDASFTVHSTNIDSEGRYVCSVSVNPVTINMDVNLQIEEAPSISLNVGPSLSLTEGEEMKVICTAEHFYPLDVEVNWYSEDLSKPGQRAGAPPPKGVDGRRSIIPHDFVHSSHKNNPDHTFISSSFFYLEASLFNSGRQFTCSISHRSLKEPITESFTLTVKGPNFWVVFLIVDLFLLYIMYKLLPRYCTGECGDAPPM